MTKTGARRVLFSGVAVGLFLILLALFAGKQAKAQEVSGYGAGPLTVCQTQAYLSQVIALRKAGQSWNTAVYAVNVSNGKTVCLIRIFSVQYGNTVSRVLLDNKAFVIRQVYPTAVFLQGIWSQVSGLAGYAAVQAPGIDL